MWNRLKSLLPKPLSEQEFQRQQDEILKHAPVPTFWLFGKTGSGKTSIVRYLTGAETAQIGNGFRPQTQHSQQFDFPATEQPLLRFLDTRGLGEARYDPQLDIEAFDRLADLMLVTVRALDHSLDGVIEPLRQIRRSRPQRPVVLALTCLHEAYPRQQHPQPDPFFEHALPEQIPEDLRRSLEKQHARFEGLVDRVVPIDLTQSEEGFEEPDFGGERLKSTLMELLPAAYRQTIQNLDDVMQPLRSLRERQATAYILSYSTLAATAAAVPTPWIDIPVVMAMQSRLVTKLADLYGQSLGGSTIGQIASTLGGGLVSRLAIRGSLKLIPFVGSAANAALAFAYTWATGRAWSWYFGEVQRGNAPSEADVRRVWREQFDMAGALWKRHGRDRIMKGTPPDSDNSITGNSA